MATSEKIRVMIVDDINETRENIRKLLQFEGDMEVVGVARTGKEAIEVAAEIRPDVVLMDINMPDMDGITATEQIRRKIPFSQIVILSVQGDPNYMRRAMLVGARDFLTKPPMPDELSAAIRRAGEMAKEEKAKAAQVSVTTNGAGPIGVSGIPMALGKIIVFYSPKGGTGCTTLACNLAVALNNSDTRVALIDGNLQYGDVAVFFNEQGRNTILDLAQRADELDPEVVKDVMVTHEASGVDILAAPKSPEMAEKVNADQFGKLLAYLRKLYSYVIVDTCSYLSEVTLTALDLSDLVVLLTMQDIPSIKNARSFLSLADGLQISRQRLIFTMNRYDKRIPITPEKIGESLKQEITAVIPFDDRIVIQAVNRGVPFMIDNKTQPIGRGVLGLAEVVRDRLAKIETPDAERVKSR
jgi:pilus assembly protein CpaE